MSHSIRATPGAETNSLESPLFEEETVSESGEHCSLVNPERDHVSFSSSWNSHRFQPYILLILPHGGSHCPDLIH